MFKFFDYIYTWFFSFEIKTKYDLSVKFLIIVYRNYFLIQICLIFTMMLKL